MIVDGFNTANSKLEIRYARGTAPRKFNKPSPMHHHNPTFEIKMTRAEHLRNDSLSSFGSLLSEENEIFPSNMTNNNLCCPASPASPIRSLNSGLAIIAATSPEIKALNLPNTPSFPDSYDFTSCHSFSSSSSAGLSQPSSSKKHRSTSPKLQVPMLPATVDQVRDSEMLPCFPANETTKMMVDDETDSLLESFRKLGTGNASQTSRDKENFSTDSRYITPSKTQLRESPANKTSLRRPSRKSLHRRISIDSLPSPAEIGTSPGGYPLITPRRDNTRRSFPYSPSDELDRVVTPDLLDRFTAELSPKAIKIGSSFQ